MARVCLLPGKSENVSLILNEFSTLGFHFFLSQRQEKYWQMQSVMSMENKDSEKGSTWGRGVEKEEKFGKNSRTQPGRYGSLFLKHGQVFGQVTILPIRRPCWPRSWQAFSKCETYAETNYSSRVLLKYSSSWYCINGNSPLRGEQCPQSLQGFNHV